MTDNPYLEITTAFNRGRLRAILSSGQAVVVHRLAVMSKDGDWILREDSEALDHVLKVLAERQSRYRFGAPLDERWLAGGWSAHLEHRAAGLRLRTDFATRPPRISPPQLAQLWRDAERQEPPVVGLEPLAALKKTNREKDYAVIGELARRMRTPRAQLLHSRGARDLMRLAEEHPQLVGELTEERPVLAQVAAGRDKLEVALDAERRALMRANEERLAAYRQASSDWAAQWADVSTEIAGLPLSESHKIIVARAEGVLPFNPRAAS